MHLRPERGREKGQLSVRPQTEIVCWLPIGCDILSDVFMGMPRVVVDTSVIVAGLRSQLGASNRILRLVAEQQFVPLVTTALFLEYEDVLNRPEQRLATGMAKEVRTRIH